MVNDDDGDGGGDDDDTAAGVRKWSTLLFTKAYWTLSRFKAQDESIKQC